MSQTSVDRASTLPTLPGDDIRQIMWGFSDRFDLQMAAQNARAVARGPVARLVAEGARNSHEWTEAKASLLAAFDEAGITSLFMDPEHGGFIEGPKNFALALAAFELAWVDAGAATCSLAGHLALSPIEERGTADQRAVYMSRCAAPQPGEEREPWRGAFCLTEPLPFVGVDTGVLSGKASVARWEEGQEPVLKIDKRGRFITNMGFANFVTAAVNSADERIRGSFMVILEQGDEGTFDRGTPTRKLVHQLSSTRDPAFNLECPAGRIIGGYTIEDGVIVPNYSHAEIIAAVFSRTRVTVGVMTAAKLLSAVEPIIRYQRGRFRGSETAKPGTPRHDLGLQMKEDVRHRLIDVWATGEAAASLGFAAARLFDVFTPIEQRKTEIFAEQGISGARAQLRALRKVEAQAIQLLQASKAADEQESAQLEQLRADPMVQFVLHDALANVMCPACKLWNTGHGATMMREAVSLMGGYGITEDCPGFLGQKWMDAQLEATYEGPEAVQRRQLGLTMTNKVFRAQLQQWVIELKETATHHPSTGAEIVSAAIGLWSWTLDFLLSNKCAEGKKLYQRQGVSFAVADALCWLLAARQLVVDVVGLEQNGSANPAIADDLPGYVSFLSDLCTVQAATAAGQLARICTELLYGYQLVEQTEEPSWVADFARLRQQLDVSTSGAKIAKDRAARALTAVMIPEALDYPA